MGGYGSQYFSEQLNPDQIVAMFNIEMIGKPAVSGPNSAWITGYERSTFGQILTDSAPDSIYTFYADPYPNQNLFYRSDNRTLARLGVPAHSISTTPIDVDPDYHQVSDEFDTINLYHLNNTIKAIARAAMGMISGEQTPTRIDPATVD
jgi:Zn-dependent M28 family amino/carboxypeptidase